MRTWKIGGWVGFLVLLTASLPTEADVFNLGGTRDPLTGTWMGMASLETVPVGDPGNTADTAEHSGNPAGQGSVGYAYNIGKYEVTAGQYTAFLNAVAATDTYGLYNGSMWSDIYGCQIQRSGSSGSYTYSVASVDVNRPVNYVSWGDSARFANWLHNNQPTGAQNLSTTEDGAYYLNGATTNAQLMAVSCKSNWKWAITSEDEWYKAACYKGGGTNAGYWNYPTRSNTAPGQNIADPSGNNANIRVAPYTWPIDSGHYTTVGGEFQNSASPYGTFDQGGNVWEWNEANISGSYRGERGGSFIIDGSFLRASARYYNPPTIEASSIGFRVSQVPEPATLSFLALGGLALLRRRRAA